MKRDPTWAAVGGRMTHGTAEFVEFARVVPTEKRPRERFWVEALVERLPEFAGKVVRTEINEDDADGNPDVFILPPAGPEIGVQVTELTHELRRKRDALRKGILRRLAAALAALVDRPVDPVVSRVFLNEPPPRLQDIQFDDLARVIWSECQHLLDAKTVATEHGGIFLTPVGSAQIYLTDVVGGIGLDVSLDLLPRNLETFIYAIDSVALKKTSCRASWLLVWSLEFFRDRHWLGDDVLRHMRHAFASLPFERIYLLDSMEGEGFFQANLRIERIRPHGDS